MVGTAYPSVFGRIHAAPLFSFLYCALLLCFVRIRPVSSVPNIPIDPSGLSILDCLFGFLSGLYIIADRLLIVH